MLSTIELIARLGLAALLGGAIGFERERLSWAAGLRTHMLVPVGACLFMIVSTFGFMDVQHIDHVTLDPSRVAAQVVSGIGFLGAGSILLRGEIVRGLTTAASLWTVAAIGLAVGGGLYVAAIAAVVIILFILAGIKPLEHWYFSSRQRRELVLYVERGRLTLQALQQEIGAAAANRITTFVVQPGAASAHTDDVLIAFSRMTEHEFQSLLARFERMPGVLKLDVRGRPDRRTQ